MLFNIVNSILFWILPNVVRKDYSKFIKISKEINKNKGSINKGKNFNKLAKFVAACVESHSNLKIGGVFASLIKFGANELIRSSKNEIITHENEIVQEPGTKRLIKTKVKMGRNWNSQLMKYIDGPTYEIFSKKIVSSRRDWMKTEEREELQLTCGVNQKCYTFLNKATFLTLEDLFTLTDYGQHQRKLVREFEKCADLYGGFFDLKETYEYSKTGSIKMKNKNKKELKNVNYYSSILGTKSKLQMSNKMNQFDVTIKVHLVQLINDKCETVNMLIKNLTKQHESVLSLREEHEDNVFPEKRKKLILEGAHFNRIKEEEIKNVFLANSESTNFCSSMVVTMNNNVERMEIFKNNAKVLKTWKRTLREGDIWKMEIDQKFPDGIYLNKLHELSLRINNTDCPMDSFLMIEAWGDNRCSVVRKNDGSSFDGVYSPVKINCEFDLEFSHLAKPSDQDTIFMIERIKDRKEFEDETIAEEFYPNREGEFNINIENIELSGERTEEKQFKLVYNDSIESTSTLRGLEEVIERVAKFDDKKASKIDEDDLRFMDEEDEDD